MSLQLDAETARKIEARSMPEPNSGCWLWIGSVGSEGYGNFQAKRIPLGAHRASYQAFNGPIPPGFVVCHKCDVRSCVNPAHLFVGTQRENILDAKRKGRLSRGASMSAAIKRSGAHARNVSRGECNGRSKLTAAQAAAIRDTTAPQRAVAEQYGVSQSTISSIRRGRRWGVTT